MGIGFAIFYAGVCDFSFLVCCILFGTCACAISILQRHIFGIYICLDPSTFHFFFGCIHFLKCRQFLCLSLLLGWMFYGRNHSSWLQQEVTLPPASLRPAAVKPLRMIAQVSKEGRKGNGWEQRKGGWSCVETADMSWHFLFGFSRNV